MQTKKEHLVQVTRCTASQTVELFYCGFQNCSGVKRYEKFHEPIMIEPADCRLAAYGKEYLFEMNARRWGVVNLVGGLDNGNCKVGLFEVNGMPLKSRVATMA